MSKQTKELTFGTLATGGVESSARWPQDLEAKPHWLNKFDGRMEKHTPPSGCGYHHPGRDHSSPGNLDMLSNFTLVTYIIYFKQPLMAIFGVQLDCSHLNCF